MSNGTDASLVHLLTGGIEATLGRLEDLTEVLIRRPGTSPEAGVKAVVRLLNLRRLKPFMEAPLLS